MEKEREDRAALAHGRYLASCSLCIRRYIYIRTLFQLVYYLSATNLPIRDRVLASRLLKMFQVRTAGLSTDTACSNLYYPSTIAPKLSSCKMNYLALAPIFVRQQLTYLIHRLTLAVGQELFV